MNTHEKIDFPTVESLPKSDLSKYEKLSTLAKLYENENHWLIIGNYVLTAGGHFLHFHHARNIRSNLNIVGLSGFKLHLSLDNITTLPVALQAITPLLEDQNCHFKIPCFQSFNLFSNPESKQRGKIFTIYLSEQTDAKPLVLNIETALEKLKIRTGFSPAPDRRIGKYTYYRYDGDHNELKSDTYLDAKATRTHIPVGVVDKLGQLPTYVPKEDEISLLKTERKINLNPAKKDTVGWWRKIFTLVSKISEISKTHSKPPSLKKETMPATWDWG